MFNIEKERNPHALIVGIGYGEPPIFPRFELLNDGYWFTLRDEDGFFHGNINKFDFESFKEWLGAQNYDNEKEDFYLDTLRCSDTKTMMNYLRFGCQEAKTIFEEIIMEYFDFLDLKKMEAKTC